MKDACTLVEFIGIPYSWKTSTLNEVQRQLRVQGITAHAVQEFRGSDNFYRRRKFSPEVNVLRALSFMTEFIQVARDERTAVVLVDRGVFDAQCWISWFERSGEIPVQYNSVTKSLLDSIQVFASRFRIVWMDRDPLAALRSHGQHPGRIVNFANLSSLREVYESELVKLAPPATSHRVESDSGSAQQLATQLVAHLKLA